MGRRNEANRLEHKKKVDSKKKREQEAAILRKEKLKAIQQKFAEKGLLIILFFTSLISQAQDVPVFEKPAAVSETSKIPLKLSTVFIPIEMQQSTLKKMLVNASPESIQLDNEGDLESYNFKFKLKDGTTSFNNNEIRHMIRFTEGNGTYKKRTATNKPWPYSGIIYSPWASVSCADIRGNALLSVKLSLQSNYQIKATSEINATIDNVACAGMNLTGLAKTFGYNNFNENLTKNIEGELKKLDLKRTFQSLWNELQKPFKINEEFYLVAKPVDISYKNIHFQDGLVKFGLGLSFYASTISPNEVSSQIGTTPLPDLKQHSNAPGNSFELNIPVQLPYTYLDKMAKEMVTGYVISSTNEKGKEKKYGKIESVELFGSKDPKYDVVIALQATLYKTVFKKKIVPIYLHAKFKYDANQKKIVVQDYKLDPKTENGFYNLSMKAVANKLAYSKIIGNLKFSVEKEINQQKVAINKYLEQKIELTKGVQLSGIVDSVELQDIIAQPTKLVCLFGMKGNVKIEVMEINF